MCVVLLCIFVYEFIYKLFFFVFMEVVVVIKIGNFLREEMEMGLVISKEYLNKI